MPGHLARARIGARVSCPGTGGSGWSRLATRSHLAAGFKFRAARRIRPTSQGPGRAGRSSRAGCLSVPRH